MFAAYIVGFVNAVMALLIAFSIVLTQTQMGAVDGVVNAFVLLVTATYHVWSTKKASAIVPPSIAASRSTIA